MIGRLCSLITFTPFANWRRQHAGHHAVWNNLDRRDSGADIYSTCLTVSEYRPSRPAAAFLYRLSRHPVITGLLLPPLVFLLLYRISFDTPKDWRRERLSVHATNAGIAIVFVGLGLALGFERVLLVQLPIMVIASIIGVWLFAVQHRFEETLWQRDADWRFGTASLQGSSYLRLPRILQWFTGNIGFHHIHHLNPRIPNYRLPACHAAIQQLHAVPSLTLWDALRAPFFALWDETRQQMVGFLATETRRVRCGKASDGSALTDCISTPSSATGPKKKFSAYTDEPSVDPARCPGYQLAEFTFHEPRPKTHPHRRGRMADREPNSIDCSRRRV